MVRIEYEQKSEKKFMRAIDVVFGNFMDSM